MYWPLEVRYALVRAVLRRAAPNRFVNRRHAVLVTHHTVVEQLHGSLAATTARDTESRAV